MLLFSVGLNSKPVSTEGNDLSSTDSKVSAASVPRTLRSEGEILQSSNIKSFSFAELKAATRSFRPDSVLGEGGFGSVYKGWIDEHLLPAAKPDASIVIAVKKLKQDSSQGHNEWLVSSNFYMVLSYLCVCVSVCVKWCFYFIGRHDNSRSKFLWTKLRRVDLLCFSVRL